MKEEKTHVGGNVSGSRNQIGVHRETHNYTGLTREDLVAMLEERFRHMLSKEVQVNAIFEENRKLTDEVIRQNADFRMYNESYRKQAERIAELTDKLLSK